LKVFEAEKKVFAFLDNEKLKVLLIQGGGGSGKSLFCHIVAKKLIGENTTEYIPIFINLPGLKDPITQVIEETLINSRFSEQ